ncbi:hypothetical protein [Nocardia camponoti]|uniref:Uncharacterized protein n=1 Tax=Nocardia camponoti TaxID=1616106 RepID=A0A917QKX6_9NOCA|nr:hypothetical protein [Nocardia camponoti]GGK54843.1 hypothetical protein GCM10011591_28380 [Nocardia camponoti]
MVDDLALLAGREAEVTSTLTALVGYYRALAQLGSNRHPPAELQYGCRQLLDLCATAVTVPATEPQSTGIPVEERIDIAPTKSQSVLSSCVAVPAVRGPGSRSPAGTVSNRLREVFIEHPNELLRSQDLVAMLVARGWEEPARPRHSIYQAMTKLVENEPRITKVGPAQWRYSTADRSADVSDDAGRARMVYGRPSTDRISGNGALAATG